MDSENLNEEIFEESKEVTQDRLNNLSNFVKVYKRLELEIEKTTQLLKEKQEAFEKVSRVQIPGLLNEVGLSELKLNTGEKVIIQDKLKASITDKNYFEAYQNMIKEEGGNEEAKLKVDDLFKTRAILNEVSDEVLEVLIEKEIPYEIKRDIPWQTLAKYCRGRLDNGKTIPVGISVFQYQETKIK